MNELNFDCELSGGRQLPAQHWPGERGVVRVSCDRQVGEGRWEPGVIVTLENREVRAGGNEQPWQAVATFDRDSERNVPLAPGEVHFLVQVPDELPRTWRLSVAKEAPAPAKPATLEQRVSRIERETGLDPAA